MTEDNGVTFTGATLTNPIPGGQLVQPVGAANGLSSQLGLALGTMYQPDRTTPYYTRWEINLQRDLGRRLRDRVHLPRFAWARTCRWRSQVNNIIHAVSYLSTSRDA